MKSTICVLIFSLFMPFFLIKAKGQTVRVEEIALIKIVVPEEFKTDYALLVKVGEAYSKAANSKTAKALDEAFSVFLKKMDDVTAKAIWYLIKAEPSKYAFEEMIKARKSYFWKHPLVYSDLDDYYKNLQMAADSLDEEGYLKPNRPRPKNPKYGEESVQRIDFDRKMLLEKHNFWNKLPSEFHELTEIENRLKVLPSLIEQAARNVDYYTKNYQRESDRAFDELPKPPVLIEAEKKLAEFQAEKNQKEAREWQISDAIGVKKMAEYETVKTLLNDPELLKLPELILKLRL